MYQHETVADVAAPKTTMHTYLLCCGLIGSILFNITYFTFGAIAPGYDMMRQPIGDLELINHGWIQSVNFIVFGLAICAFAAGLRKELAGGFGATLIPLFQVFIALGVILAGIFIHEPIHTTASIIAFVSMLISFLLLARRFAGDPRWKGWTTYTILTVVLMILLFVIFCYAKSRDGAYAGIFERLVVVTRLVWSIIFIIRLLDGRKLAPYEVICARQDPLRNVKNKRF
jgi:hypothetical membrane protein